MSSPPSNPTPKKRRGAQPGNRNALKHGYYARQFNHRSLADLANPQPGDLDLEIGLMRLLTRRLLESSNSLTDIESVSAALRSFTLASLAFSRLVRTRFVIQGLPGEAGKAFLKAARLAAARASAARLLRQGANPAGVPPKDPNDPDPRRTT